ncbi:Pentatricopeptide repeat-containing protein [Drosera capensis]
MAVHSIAATPSLRSPSHHLPHPRHFPSGYCPFPHRPSPTRLNLRSIECTSQNASIVGSTTKRSTVDYESTGGSAWYDVYKAISKEANSGVGPLGVLDEFTGRDKWPEKLELTKVIKALRKSFKARIALQVCEWMNEKTDVYSITSGDRAIQLDLIAKVHGVSAAEDYFLRIPDAEKDNKIYGSLLNTYVSAKMKDKAENLREKARSLGIADSGLQYTAMIILYMKYKDYDKAESLISELRQKKLEFNFYVYNMWLSCRAAQGSIEDMEEVFEIMTSDSAVAPHWTTFSIMATAYIRALQLEKAKGCLKSLEACIVRREKKPYHYLLSLYASVGEKAEVHRVWSSYKLLFSTLTTWSYKAMISALNRLRDSEVEKVYEEWLASKQPHDIDVTNQLMSWHIKQGSFEKAKTLFYQIIEMGRKPNPSTWYIVAKGHVQEGNISEALSCLKEAALITESQRSTWKPNPTIIAALVKQIKRDADESGKDVLISLLKQFGCLDDKSYLSELSKKGVQIVGEDFHMVKSEVIADADYDDGGTQRDMEMEESEQLFSGIK